MLCFLQLISILTMQLCAALKQFISYSKMKFNDGGGFIIRIKSLAEFFAMKDLNIYIYMKWFLIK